MKFMKECTSTHINSTLKIYIQLKSQHGEPTAVSSISPTWFPPQFVNLASFTANVYNICTVHTFYNGDSFHWMTKEALNAVRLSETKYKVLIKNKKTTTHIQTDNNRYSEHLLGWQIDNTGMYFWRQTGKKKEKRGGESQTFKSILWLLVNSNLNVMLNSWEGWGSNGWGSWWWLFSFVHSRLSCSEHKHVKRQHCPHKTLIMQSKNIPFRSWHSSSVRYCTEP